MKQFIRLHNTDNNTVVLVSVSDIELVDSEVYDNRVVAKVFCSFLQDGFLVNETPEKIYSLLKGQHNCNIIRLHNSDTNSVILTTVDGIKLIDTVFERKRTVSRVYTQAIANGFTVNETVDKIYAMVSEVNPSHKKTT